jgi:site-specific DNA recombinase
MLASLAARRATKAAGVDVRLLAIEKEAHEVSTRLRRLYQLVEDGTADVDDLLKGRIATLKADRDRLHATLDRARSQTRRPIDIGPSLVRRFTQTMREKLTGGEISFRKAYLGSIIDRVEVDDRQIRIVGRKDVLEQAIAADGAPVSGVRSFVRKWRTGQDSNPRPPDS